jgi:hypothetical protein
MPLGPTTTSEVGAEMAATSMRDLGSQSLMLLRKETSCPADSLVGTMLAPCSNIGLQGKALFWWEGAGTDECIFNLGKS